MRKPLAVALALMLSLSACSAETSSIGTGRGVPDAATPEGASSGADPDDRGGNESGPASTASDPAVAEPGPPPIEGTDVEAETAASAADSSTATRLAEGPPPEPPPEDAVVLIVDDMQHQARFAELYEVHWYRFEAQQGQDYWIFAAPFRRGSPGDVDAAISLHDATGVPIEVAERSDHNRVSWMLLRAAEAATYYVRVLGERSGRTGQYAIAVRAINDDHGNTAGEGTEIDLDAATEHVAAFDFWGDADWFVFEAQAGETFDVRARWLPDSEGRPSPELYQLLPAEDAEQGDGTESGVRRLKRWGTPHTYDAVRLKPWHIEESGRYALRLVGSADAQAFPRSYTVTFEFFRDDHSNVPPGATPLEVGRAVAGSLDYRVDEDWFSVDLAAPNKYLVQVLSAQGERVFADVSLYDAGSRESYGSYYALQADELVDSQDGRLLWQARESGEHIIRVADDESWRPDGAPTDYVIRVSTAGTDDHADGPEGATSVDVGEWVAGTLDEETDTDWFRFGAERGVVYTVEHEEFDQGSGSYVAIDEDYPWGDAVLSFVDSGWRIAASDGVVATTGGDVDLEVSGHWPGLTRYRFRIVAHEEEDYSDDRAGAVSIGMADAVRGSASDQDVDWFVLDTPVAGIYFARARQSQPGAFSVTVFDEDGLVDSLYPSRSPDRDPSRFWGGELWRAAAGDRFWIRVIGKWPALFHYRLLLDYSDAADDHGNSAEEATAVVFDPASVPAEVQDLEHRRDRSAAEVGVPQVVIEGEIGKFVDEDWFALPVEEGVKYLIHSYVPEGAAADRPNFKEDGRLVLWDGDTFIGSWSRWNPPIGFVPSATGTYHVQVGDYLLAFHSGPWTYGFEVAVLAPDGVSDTREGASTVQVGETVEGVLDTLGDFDWYFLDAVEGQTWLLETPSGDLGCVEVHGPGQADVLVERCDQSRLVWSAPATGRYGMRFSAHWRLRNLPSEYRFTLSELDPDDHGNDPARASALVPGHAQSGLIDYVGDVDVFRLPVAAEEVWVLDVTHSDYGTDFRADFVPVNGDADPANSLRVDDDGAYLASPVSGTWLVSVGGEDAFGDYTLTATRWDVPDDYGDSRRDAHPIPAPERPESECRNDPAADGCPLVTTVAGSVDYPGDSDYFRLELVAGRKYALSVDGASWLAVLSEGDCVPGVREVWEAESSGTYWVRVSGAGAIEPPQDYVLTITRLDDDWVDPWVDPWDLATQLELNEVHEDTIAEPGEIHYYRIRLDHPNYLLELHGDVWDTARSPNDRGTSYSREGSRLISQLPFDPPVVYEFSVSGDGEYSVVVREWSHADELLGWNSGHGSVAVPAPTPYCAAEAG